MKKLIVFFSMLCSMALLAQERGVKNDIIVTKDGELIQAKVVKVTANAISFNYPGETVINEVAVSELQKIVFSSGRTQLFGKSAAAAPSNALVEEPTPIPQEEIYLGPGTNYVENQLTVLPLSYVKNGTHSKKLSNQMTSFVTAFMASNAKPYGIEVADMSATIDRLVNADIGYQKLASASIEELRTVLESEFILKATLTDNTERSVSRDLYAETDNSGHKTGISIELELFAADNEKERYEVSFSEEISLQQAAPILEGKWKSSIKYVLQQLLSSQSLR